MSLLQNVTLNAQYPYRRSGATGTNTETGYMRSQHGIRGMSQMTRFMLLPRTSGVPTGYSAAAIFKPLTAIDMASFREADIAVQATGNGAMGYGIAGAASVRFDASASLMAIVWAGGSATFALDGAAVVTGLAHMIASGLIAVDASLTSLALGQMAAEGRLSVAAQALGELVVSGQGTAAFAIDAIAAASAALSGEGTARFAVDAEGDLVGAFFGTGTGRLAIDADGALSGIGELAAAGLIGVVGSLTPYGLGHAVGSTEGGGDTLSPGAVAAAVWAATAGTNNVTGSMGEKLNDAGSAANPWTEVIESGYTAAEILRVLAAVAAGKKTVDGGTVTFRDIADTKDRVTGTVSGSNRTGVTLEVDA